MPKIEKPKIDLTGVWTCDDGGTYFVRHVGNKVWWKGTEKTNDPYWCNVAHGAVKGNILKVKWADIPPSRTTGSGDLSIRIASEAELVLEEGDGLFGGKRWERKG